MPSLAVIGTGSMGTNHVRTARAIRNWEDVVVIDVDADRARGVADANGFRWAPSLDAVLGSIDAAVVAVPNGHHESVMEPLLEYGVHTLLEKPVAADLAAAERICELAKNSSARVLIGHIERFNSAVAEVMLHAKNVMHVECRRVGSVGGRPLGDVVADLMVHDLDIVRAIAETREGSAVFTDVNAMWGAASQEMCTALLRTEGGLTATLVASRAGQFKDRTVVLTGPDSQITADLVHQSVTIHRLEQTEFVSNGRVLLRQRGTTEIPFLDSGEPLLREQHHLLQVVLGTEEPLVTLGEGIEAMKLVDRVRAAAGGLRVTA